MKEASKLETVATVVDPMTGLALVFANALKLARGVPGTAFIPDSRPLLGYRSPPNRLEVPASWAVEIKKLRNPLRL